MAVVPEPTRLRGGGGSESVPGTSVLSGDVSVLSRTSGYALHATLHIAARSGPDKAVPAATVAEALDIPANYLAKILNTLAREGILTSERGRTGGFRLAREPEAITLLEVVRHFDEIGEARQCLLRSRACSEVRSCPAHEEWKAASDPAFRFFEEHTVADLMTSFKSRGDAVPV